jgi:RNase P subunit RPR2
MGASRVVGAKHHAPEMRQRRLKQRMFLIDKRGERPICSQCHKPFAATAKQVRVFRREHAQIAITCPDCIIRDCGRPETLHRRESAIAI